MSVEWDGFMIGKEGGEKREENTCDHDRVYKKETSKNGIRTHRRLGVKSDGMEKNTN